MADLKPKQFAIAVRFAEAVLTGEHCGTSIEGPRRYAALSLSAFSRA
jgi:hypothetical protein